MMEPISEAMIRGDLERSLQPLVGKLNTQETRDEAHAIISRVMGRYHITEAVEVLAPDGTGDLRFKIGPLEFAFGTKLIYTLR